MFSKIPILVLLFFCCSHLLNAQVSDSIILCTNGVSQVSNAPSGVVYDSGGPFGYYDNYENCSLLIDPGCAVSIQVRLWEGSVESCCDRLYIYDGENENGVLLFVLSGWTNPVDLVASSGKLYLQWFTDGSAIYEGFRLTWSSTLSPAIEPVTTFTVSNSNPALSEPIYFSGEATNYPLQWSWDFGDGTVSGEQNVSHTYHMPGEYTVQLIATNCHGLSDTATQLITVQEPPAAAVDPALFDLTGACGDTVFANINLSNSGAGDLLYRVKGHVSGKIKVLMYEYNAFYNSIDGVSGVVNFFGNNDIELFHGTPTDSASLAQSLAEMDVLLFPELAPSTDIWFLRSMKGAIDDFIQRGGSVIVCGANYYNAVLSAYDFFQIASPSTSEFSYNNIPVNNSHPITAGMPVSYYTPYFTGGIMFQDPAYYSLSTYLGNSVVGYKESGNGSLVYLGFNFQNYNTPLANMLVNAMKWCGKADNLLITPGEGEVAPGNSQNIQVGIPTHALTEGHYAGQVSVQTNDPLQPLLEILFTLQLNGQALLQPEPAQLDFAPIMQFSSATLPLAIHNPGCDTLIVTNLGTANGAFTISQDSLVLLPFSSGSVEVTFAPQDTGLYLANLVFESNAGSNILPLTAYAFGAPVITFTPDHIDASFLCGDTLSTNIQIFNNGLGNLVLTDDIKTGSSAQPKILILDNVAYFYPIGYALADWIATDYPNGVFEHYNAVSLAELSAKLLETDLLVLPALGGWLGSNYSYSELGALVRAYMESGGSVLLTGTPNIAVIQEMGLMNIVNSGNFYSQNAQISGDPDHSLLNNVNFNSIVYDDIFAVVTSDNDFIPLADINGYHTLGYKHFGSGLLVFIACECEYNYDVPVQLVRNAAAFLLRPSWIQVKANVLQIAPGESGQIQVSLSANNLVAGTYNTLISIGSNDPAQPLVEIPVTLHVDGAPGISLGTSALGFGIVQQFTQKTLDFEISNPGCDTLFLNGATINSSDFELALLPDFIAPLSAGTGSVRFVPLAPGSFQAVLSGISDAGNFEIALSGIAVGAPVGSVTPLTMETELECDQTVTLPLLVENSGLGSMSFTSGTPPSPRKIATFGFGANIYRLQNLKNGLQNAASGIEFVEFNGNDAAVLAELLKQSSVLFIPSISDYSGTTAYNTFAPVLQTYLNAGNSIVVVGMDNPEPLKQMGVFNNFNYEFNSWYNVSPAFSAHPLAYQMPEQFICNDYGVNIAFQSGSGFRPVIDGPNGYSYLGYRQTGAGQAIYWASTLEYTPDNNAFQLLDNILTWSYNPLPPGVSVSPQNGFIPAGGNTPLQFNFDGSGLVGGQYTGSFHLYSNDPVHNPIVVPVTLNVGFKPCADFTFQSYNCSGLIDFYDNTTNSATSWYWTFGDGAESFSQHPQHVYTQSGVYTVKLVACNNSGCDTIQNTVQVGELNGPVEMNCLPATLGACCSNGIHRVRLNELDYQSGDAETEGYQNFSCNWGTDLTAGIQYEINIETGNQYQEYARVWIDYNNNGFFSANELVFSDLQYTNHQGYLVVPTTAVKNVPLRMRVSSDVYYANIPGPCTDLSNGQAEDYYVVVKNTSGSEETVPGGLNVRVYPNPSAEDVWLEYSSAENGTIHLRLLDASGKKVYEDKTESATGLLQLPHLPAGTYFLEIQSGQTVRTEKIMRVLGF